MEVFEDAEAGSARAHVLVVFGAVMLAVERLLLSDMLH